MEMPQAVYDPVGMRMSKWSHGTIEHDIVKSGLHLNNSVQEKFNLLLPVGSGTEN